jgi:hypothetical protein
MPLTPEIRAFYAAPAMMTELGGHAGAVRALPVGVAEVSAAVQGLLIHQFWQEAYGVAPSPARAEQTHRRTAAAILEAVGAAPLRQARAPAERAVGVCRHFSVVAVAMLRAQGIAARARVGFATYLQPGLYLDHWVVEYWHEARGRWVLADAQIDAVQAAALKPDFDVLDVPRDRFVLAGDAWRQCRSGAADPARFGILDMWGLWFVAHNLLLDFAALNNMEMLPWDDWGPMVPPGEQPTPEQLVLFDRLADLTLDPDTRFAELRGLYRDDALLPVPAQVFNAIRQRLEPV